MKHLYELDNSILVCVSLILFLLLAASESNGEVADLAPAKESYVEANGEFRRQIPNAKVSEWPETGHHLHGQDPEGFVEEVKESIDRGQQQPSVTLRPVIEGGWWQVAGNPDLGEYTSPKQEPVDFGVWQAADGTWQLWSCIRYTKCGGNTT